MKRIREVLGIVGIALLLLLIGCDWLSPIDPLPVPAPGGALFFDDFEDGVNPAWAFVTGPWITFNGRIGLSPYYTAEPAYAVISTGISWRDYRIEANIRHGDDYGHSNPYRIGFVVRAQDNLNKVVFWATRKNGCWFSVEENGQVTVAEGGKVSANIPEECALSIEVINGSYDAYINGIRVTTFSDSTFSAGMPGVALGSAKSVSVMYFKDFRVTALD